MRFIDAHAHLPIDDDRSLDFYRSRDIGLLNIGVDSPELGGLDAQQQWYRQLSQREPGRFRWVTSFSLSGFATSGWATRAIESLARDFDTGATGCKVWKNVGMHLRDPQTGDFVYLDDERFAPVLDFVQRSGRPLLAHIAEPIDAWRELDPRSPHFGYYSTAKQWHWHGRDDVPSHERLIASRDAVVERYPKLTFVALHLGSQEHDLRAVAERLDRWPNYVVDTAARWGDLLRRTQEDRPAVRDFFVRYAERIVWGVDHVLTQPTSSLEEASRRSLLSRIEARYIAEHEFFTTKDPFDFEGGRAEGLMLDETTFAKLTRENARRLYGF